MVEILLDENKFIRTHVNDRYRELSRLAENMGFNDGDEIEDLKQKIQILSEENNILLNYLEDQKVKNF